MALFAKEKADVEVAKAAQVLAVVCTRDSLEGATLLMKYKVGDMVRIRKDLHLGIYAVYERMTKYKGLKARIERVNRDGGFYVIDIDGGVFCWTDKMLEGVDEETDATDKTIKPDYYEKAAMQPLEVMQAMMTEEQFKGFLLGNCIKYRMRKNYKGQHDSDEYKARQYAYWLGLVKEGEKINPSVDIVPDDFTFKAV